MRSILLLTCLISSSFVFAQMDNSGKTITTAAGDMITFNEGKVRTVTIKSTGATKDIIVAEPRPVLLGNEKIYYRPEDFDEEVNSSDAQANFYDEWENFRKTLKEKIAAEGITLPAGTYVFPIKNAVMNTYGRYVYYEATGVRRTVENPNRELKPQTNSDLKPIELELDEATAKKLDNIFTELYEKTMFTPLVYHGKPTVWVHNYTYEFEIK